MNLYTNGCSWTWGGGLDEYFFTKTPEYPIQGVYSNEKRLKIVWPTHLGKILGANKVTDLSSGCGSNQRIVRTTFDWLRQQSAEELQDTIAVIQITELSRFEMYNPLDDSSENHSGDWMKCKIDIVNSEPEHNHRQGQKLIKVEELLKEVNRRLKYNHHIEDVYRTIGYLYALKGMFEAYKLKDFYIWIQNNHWAMMMPREYYTNIFENFKVLDDDRFGEPWTYQTVSKLDNHPGVHGHRQLAHIIYDNMLRKGYKR